MHMYRTGQRVRIARSMLQEAPLGLRNLASEQLEIADIMSVAPGEVVLAGHKQRLKVRIVGERWQSEWVSGAWFEPAS